MGNDINIDAFRLFAEPSFFQGVGTLMDPSGALLEYNYSKTEEEADARAIASDWFAVGKDLRKALDSFSKEHMQKKKPQR